MPSPGGKGVDHILLCPPERASLAPPPPATFLAIVEKSKRVFLAYHTIPALREGSLCPPSGERLVNQEDSFDLDKLLKSQKTHDFFNI